MTMWQARIGKAGLKIRDKKDPNAFSIGRIVRLPSGNHAVIICQLTGHGQWGAQHLDSGELCIITVRAGKRSDLPIVGHYSDATLF